MVRGYVDKPEAAPAKGFVRVKNVVCLGWLAVDYPTTAR
jgi:hypothetical protein